MVQGTSTPRVDKHGGGSREVVWKGPSRVGVDVPLELKQPVESLVPETVAQTSYRNERQVELVPRDPSQFHSVSITVRVSLTQPRALSVWRFRDPSLPCRVEHLISGHQEEYEQGHSLSIPGLYRLSSSGQL